MKYRIRKHTHSYLKTIIDAPGKHHVEKVTEEWYQASRKGLIFGFWHVLGHEYCWDDLNPYRTDTLEDIEDYIHKWHEIHYGDSYKCEIIKELYI